MFSVSEIKTKRWRNEEDKEVAPLLREESRGAKHPSFRHSAVISHGTVQKTRSAEWREIIFTARGTMEQNDNA